ncbi:sporulation integral membrane protein YtvI [Paenibacillus thiaminolyticus]|nr:sporulation integral membrane protein YtvI [Paenibacillus thiaminolyticus]
MNHILLKRLWRGSLVLGGSILVCVACYVLLPVMYPFLIAWLIALLLNPIVDWMSESLRFPRWLSVTVSLLLFLLGMMTIAAAVITRIVKEIYTVSLTMDYTLNQWRDLFIRFFDSGEVQQLIHLISSIYKDNPNVQESINRNLADTAQTVTTAITNLITLFLDGIVRLLTSLPNVATIAIVVLLAAFFISKDWLRWRRTVLAWVQEPLRTPAGTIWHDLKGALFGYCRAQFLLISMTMVFVTIGLILLRVDYAITIGLLVGLVDLLPYLGVGAVMVPWMIYSFAIGNASFGIGLAVLYAIVLVARQVMEPKVLASSLGLDPLIMLMATFAGLKLLGVLGLIAGPVAVVIIAALHRAGIFTDLRNYIMAGRH